MSVQRPDPEHDAAAVAEATGRLIDAVTRLDPPALTEPSLLPDWTRGHVLAHLARSADSMVNLLAWAQTGEEVAQYESEEARARDIEDGARRTLDEHLDELRITADRLAMAIEKTQPQAWATQVRMRSGNVIAAAEIPWRRLIELELHHVDLGIGYGFQDLPAAFITRELAQIIDGLSGHEGIAAVRLSDSGSGEHWDLGAADEPEVTVSGTADALLAWLARGVGEGLTVEPERPLPVLPPLG